MSEISKQLSVEIMNACAYFGIPRTRAELLAGMVGERMAETLCAGPDVSEARRARDERIRAEYVGKPGQAEAIAKREGISPRQVCRIANGR